MIIKVSGKQRLSGKSKKTGNDYDFIQVHYLGKARGVEGLAALTLNLDPHDCKYENISIGVDYRVEFDNRGYPVEFERVSAAPGK